MKVLKIFSILAFTNIFSPSDVFAHDHHSELKETRGKPSSESVFNLNSKWVNQEGNAFRIEALRGGPSVVSMAYTKCESSCSLIIEDMKRIEADLKEKLKAPQDLKFVLFSFDTTRDTPAQLKSFASARKFDPANWILLQGDKKSVRELAAVLGIRYKQDSKGEFDHSNVITLLDSEGVVRYQQIGIGQKREEFIGKLVELLKQEPKTK